LGLWEHLNNPDFNPVEFDGFKKQAGLNSFTLTPKQWIEKTKAIGLISKAGRYGGTYGHKDIAFEFASWISAEFTLCVIKECQRLKEKSDAEIPDAPYWEALYLRKNYHSPRDGLQRVPDPRLPS
jgi:hypothetical protein